MVTMEKVANLALAGLAQELVSTSRQKGSGFDGQGQMPGLQAPTQCGA